MSPLKIGRVKFVQCPVAVITDKTWDILRIINNTTTDEVKPLMPFRGTSYEDQPKWYWQAVAIVRGARAENNRIQRAKRG